MKTLTQSGTYVDFCPDGTIEIERIDIYDIAHALSNLCRFGGHALQFYSVAQHAILVSYHCKHPLEGLMHDAAEAYLGDVISPLKAVIGEEYKRYERALSTQIQGWFGLLDWYDLPDVKEADRVLLATEARDVMAIGATEWDAIQGVEPLQRVIVPVPPLRAMEAFIKRFGQLGGGDVKK